MVKSVEKKKTFAAFANRESFTHHCLNLWVVAIMGLIRTQAGIMNAPCKMVGYTVQ